MSCPSAHIHQRCLAFDAPNLLIFVESIRIILPGPPSFPILSPALLSMIHLIPAPKSSCIPCAEGGAGEGAHRASRNMHLPLLPCLRPFRPAAAAHVLTKARPGRLRVERPAGSAAGLGWGELPSVGKKDQFNFVHKITANKLQIMQDTFIIDLCRGAESSITFCLAQGPDSMQSIAETNYKI